MLILVNILVQVSTLLAALVTFLQETHAAQGENANSKQNGTLHQRGDQTWDLHMRRHCYQYLVLHCSSIHHRHYFGDLHSMSLQKRQYQ